MRGCCWREGRLGDKERGNNSQVLPCLLAIDQEEEVVVVVMTGCVMRDNCGSHDTWLGRGCRGWVIPIIIGRPDTEYCFTRNTTQTMKMTVRLGTMRCGARQMWPGWPAVCWSRAGAERLQSARKCLNTNSETQCDPPSHPRPEVTPPLLMIKYARRERELLASARTKDNAEVWGPEVPGGCVSNCQ